MHAVIKRLAPPLPSTSPSSPIRGIYRVLVDDVPRTVEVKCGGPQAGGLPHIGAVAAGTAGGGPLKGTPRPSLFLGACALSIRPMALPPEGHHKKSYDGRDLCHYVGGVVDAGPASQYAVSVLTLGVRFESCEQGTRNCCIKWPPGPGPHIFSFNAYSPIASI